MKKGNHVIFGVHITERTQHASQVQDVLTRHGGCIKTRLGLHELGRGASSPNGMLLLEVCGSASSTDRLNRELKRIRGVQVKQMVFSHP